MASPARTLNHLFWGRGTRPLACCCWVPSITMENFNNFGDAGRDLVFNEIHVGRTLGQLTPDELQIERDHTRTLRKELTKRRWVKLGCAIGVGLVLFAVAVALYIVRGKSFDPVTLGFGIVGVLGIVFGVNWWGGPSTDERRQSEQLEAIRQVTVDRGIRLR